MAILYNYQDELSSEQNDTNIIDATPASGVPLFNIYDFGIKNPKLNPFGYIQVHVIRFKRHSHDDEWEQGIQLNESSKIIDFAGNVLDSIYTGYADFSSGCFTLNYEPHYERDTEAD